MKTGIVWLRQDLRLKDNPTLTAACKECDKLAIVYIPDAYMGKAQKWWLFQSLQSLNESLEGNLIIRKGKPAAVLAEIAELIGAEKIYYSRRYEPDHREPKLPQLESESFNSSLLIEPWDITPQTAPYYRVFTPFWKRALQLITLPKALPKPKLPKLISLPSDEIVEPKISYPGWEPGEAGAHKQLKRFVAPSEFYKEQRDFPAQKGTSRLSPHLHFGEISPFDVYREIENVTYRSELGWREFSYHLLYHFPKLPTEPFDERFGHFPWKEAPEHLKAWQMGKTGYPIVDAGMRELLATGWMHNRVRMIVASFLTKDLKIHWREGADWFLEHLVDADLASNSASWQWVAGCGADAAPYFRIFNPLLQGEKFDPTGEYILKWCPEYEKDPHTTYDPIIDHSEARDEALAIFTKLSKGKK